MNYTLIRDYKISSFKNYNLIETYILKKSHPISIIFEIIGIVWITYYLWYHLWPYALIVLLLTKTLSFVSVYNVNTDNIAHTLIGKIALLHLHPVNLLIQLFGFGIYLIGVWNHSVEALLFSVSIIFLGHLCGWKKVNPNLSTES
ncbi:hypothetical protein SHI21_16605 [Bacteriovorax sp. PP10]|uniref:Uncharacterized protein n=1 Tax=Bacteriovorax antarcticus TaxID=3088717 RepID=A0ABU5VZX3_9BACT|nr:hypothetical protein [Bacteriovorax sp. PP10]MEA9357854.1 hypothetical protein [Bacteriovorax sp. PP10]